LDDVVTLLAAEGERALRVGQSAARCSVSRYLISLQTASGLIKGGPDVGWVSTQHNLIALAVSPEEVGSLVEASDRGLVAEG
jgi:hypothetical protein